MWFFKVRRHSLWHGDSPLHSTLSQFERTRDVGMLCLDDSLSLRNHVDISITTALQGIRTFVSSFTSPKARVTA
ncbi:hypothetical protein Ciccas_006174 [Cichlidogyrus casuarinus]|uniref:Uncharacterized protein n=1 Tax=Cichlidogyrus casuarinus TaxID=1844966 RepID=A0ABD2Q6K4_9PLAT